MTSKAVPLSVRVSEDDAVFLSQLQVPGATTPSDKLRGLIRDARHRAERRNDYAGWARATEELTGPAKERLHALEHEAGLKSPLMNETLHWLGEAIAFSVATLGKETASNATPTTLVELERGVLDRIFLLLESVLRQGVTRESRCYEPDAISKRIGTVLELCEVIAASQQLKK